MSTIEKLHRARAYPTLRIESAPDGLAHWLYMHEDVGLGVRPCFRTPLMEDMWAFLSSISLREGQAPSELRHVVLASSAPAFNLGGDLELFARLIRSQDRERLLSYARRCVDGVHHIHGGLGGGLELALSCHTIVAEEGVDMGLPEVVFDLFPGMGAYSYLCKRVSPRVAEKLIMDGALLSSQEMHRLGVVDVLVPRGQGEAAVADLIRRQQRSPHSQLAMNKMRQIAQPTSYQELMAITELWVDTALALPDKALRTMDRIVRAQERRAVAA